MVCIHVSINHPDCLAQDVLIISSQVSTSDLVGRTLTVNLHLGDHMSQIAEFQLASEKENLKLITYRKINRSNIEKFKTLLLEANWSPVHNSANAAACYTQFHLAFMRCFDSSFPEKTTKVKNSSLNIKWISEDLLKMERQLDALHIIIAVTHDKAGKELYRLLKDDYRKRIDASKRKAFGEYLNNAENKVSAAWRVVKAETGKSKKDNSEVNLTADEFNRFFISAGTLIPAASTNIVNDPANLVKKCSTSILEYGDISTQDVSKIIDSLKNKNTKDIYGISPKLLKEVAPIISQHLQLVLNKCLIEGFFPCELKIAKVTPIHKKGSMDDCSNYRPISILPTISKILETFVKDKLADYLTENKLLTECQHGYIKNKSTSTALLALLQQIITGFDERKLTQIAFCDLSKAFDTVDHNILIRKMENYGIQEGALTLLISYLQNRQQRVHWNGMFSDWKDLTKGVPQGSILGPLLFIIYVNDLPVSIPAEAMCLYADDTSFVTRSCDLEDLNYKTTEVLETAEKWFASNKLQLNINKTKILTFHTKVLGDANESMRFLGVTFTETLNWNEHIALLRKRLSGALYCLRMLKKTVPTSDVRSVYYAYFHSIATYGIMTWGVSGSSVGVFRMQKTAIRILSGLQQKESCRGWFRKQRILTLPCSFMRACLEYIHAERGALRTNATSHSYGTRHGENLLIPFHRIEKSQNTYHYTAIKLYNALPATVKSLTKPKFKSTIKAMLVKGEFYSMEEYFAKIRAQ